MKIPALRSIALLATAVVSLVAAELPAGFRFLDPGMEQRAADDEHGRVIVYFCGHCPRAKAFMGSTIKALHDAIAANGAPLELICATPELTGDALAAYVANAGLEQLAAAHDSVNAKNISTNNIYQIDFFPGKGGKSLQINFANIDKLTALAADPARHGELGSYRFDPSGIDNEAVRSLWAAVEGRQPQAIARLVKAGRKAKAGDPIGDQFIALRERVTTAVQAELAALIAAEPSFSVFEKLEGAIANAEGLDVKDAVKHLKSLAKDKAIKNELKARAIYRQCLELAASNKPKEQEKSAAGFRMLSEQFADTVYGLMASGR